MDVLKKLVSDARGEASKRVLEYIRDHLGRTKCIFVVGQTGHGKTSALKELTGIDLEVGEGALSGTLHHHVCPAVIGGEQYIFIDTAGFGAADLDNTDNFIDIAGCLNALGPFVDIAGILFVYGSDHLRMTNETLRTIQWVQCFCGPEFFRNVVFVTTKWDLFKPKAFNTAWTRMENFLGMPELAPLFRPPPYHIGARTYHHGLPGGLGSINGYNSVLDKDEDSEQRSIEIKSMIIRNFRNAPIIPLQVTAEMGPKGDWSRTEAGKVLAHNPQSIGIHIQNRRAVVYSKSKASHESGNSAENHANESARKNAAADNSLSSRNAGPQRPTKTWSQSVLEWLEVAVAVAVFFQKTSQAPKGKDSKEASKEATKSWFSLWSNLPKWFTGGSGSAKN